MTRSKKGAGRKDDEDEHTLDDFPNEYAGYHPGQGETEVPVVRPDIDPREFFERFVATRRPCILDGALRDEAWKVRRRPHAGVASLEARPAFPCT